MSCLHLLFAVHCYTTVTQHYLEQYIDLEAIRVLSLWLLTQPTPGPGRQTGWAASWRVVLWSRSGWRSWERAGRKVPRCCRRCRLYDQPVCVGLVTLGTKGEEEWTMWRLTGLIKDAHNVDVSHLLRPSTWKMSRGAAEIHRIQKAENLINSCVSCPSHGTMS